MSHPSWVCGLKLVLNLHHRLAVNVTPFVGVWIETYVDLASWLNDIVTPFVGVWIETLSLHHEKGNSKVTPFVGVWIETLIGGLFGKHNTSHPSWVCGLKHYDYQLNPIDMSSHPSWVCGLKHILTRS